MFKRVFISMAAVAAMALVACGDDEEGVVPGPDPVIPDGPQGTMEVLNPTESKEFLEKSSIDFMNKFNAQDQSAIINHASYFCDAYDGYDVDIKFESEKHSAGHAAARFMRGFSGALRTASPSRATAAATTYVYNVSEKDVTGVWAPDAASMTWKKIADSKNVEVRFKGHGNADCVLLVEFSGDHMTGDISVPEYNEDWIDGEYVEYTDTTKVNYSVPRNIKFSFTAGRSVLAEGTVLTDLNEDAHTLSVKVNTTVANLAVSSVTEGTDTEISAVSSFTVNGEVLVTEKATVNGTHMCDRDWIERLIEEEIPVQDTFNKAVATANVNNQVSIDADINVTKALVDVVKGGNYFDSYEYNRDKAAAESAVKNYCDVVNRYCKGIVRYNNTTTTQATFEMGYTFEAWSTEGWESWEYWEYETQPLLRFSDDTTYSFEEYFESGFGNVEKTAENLSDTYESLWHRAIK